MSLVADMLNLNCLWEFKIWMPVGSAAEALPYFLNPWYQYSPPFCFVFSCLDNEIYEGYLLMSNLASLRAWESACLLDISAAISKSLAASGRGIEEFILTHGGFLLSSSKEKLLDVLLSRTRTFFLELQTKRKAKGTGLLTVTKLLTAFKGTPLDTIYMHAVTCQVIWFLLNVRDSHDPKRVGQSLMPCWGRISSLQWQPTYYVI